MCEKRSIGKLFLKETSETFRSQKRVADRAIAQAKDDWTTLSIPRGPGESDECDHRVRKGMHP